MNDEWCTCAHCDNEYKVIFASQDKPRWCPFCGSETESVEEDYDLEQDEE